MSSNPNTTQKALLFIPDISGFTEFVHHTEVYHSKHIISELLEVLLDANVTGLQLAEIEGDALFMYKLCSAPDIEELDTQVKQMYIAFHTHLKRYEYERICQCGACSSAYNLSLKFVAHFGDVDFIKVKNIIKPYGSNVIKVHRLLKNDILASEYSLITKSIFKKSKIENEQSIISRYDFGEIEYTFKTLSHLKKELPYVAPIPHDAPKHKLFYISKTIKIPVLDLYEIVSNFDYRLLWVKGVDALEYEKNKVNRAGIKHQCLFDKRSEIDQITIKKEAKPNQWVYGESTNQAPFTKSLSLYHILEDVGDGVTKLEVEAYADFKPFGIIFKPLLSKKLKNNILENLKELILLIDSGFTIDNYLTKNENP